jgi:hypothetical protein
VRVVAGVDVGNTTTEVVLVDAAVSPPVPLLRDRAPTRGGKGSETSLHGAVTLVRRLERRLGRPAELVAAAPQRPVDTRAVSLPEAAPATGRLVVVRAGGATPGGAGTAVGAPRWADDAPAAGAGSVVLLARAGFGFERTVAATRAWAAAGADVRGLLLADDEGVLVAARLDRSLPVADEVDVAAVAGARLVAVEVRAPGHPLLDLVDPIRLSALLGLDPSERRDAVTVADTLADVSRGVVALGVSVPAAWVADPGEMTLRSGGGSQRLAAAELGRLGVGAVASWRPPGGSAQDVDDLWAVELRDVAASVAARVDPTTARALVVAALHGGGPAVDPAVVLGGELGRPVVTLPAEAAAARAGALTTPGARTEALVVDLGGGTFDVVGRGGREVVVAGAGEMLTVAVATYLGLPRGAADWVKRGPCSRLEAPQVLLAEDGSRRFLDRPAPAGSVGSLVAAGPAGLLPFGGAMAPAEWRALRLRTKQRVLADNVARAVRSLGERPADVLLVGGAAADEELLGLLRPVLPGAAVGRGDVAGGLGHRYAVAYGLVLLATAGAREG